MNYIQKLDLNQTISRSYLKIETWLSLERRFYLNFERDRGIPLRSLSYAGHSRTRGVLLISSRFCFVSLTEMVSLPNQSGIGESNPCRKIGNLSFCH